MQAVAIELDALSFFGRLHPNEAGSLVGEAPGLDHSKRIEQVRPDRPQQQHTIVSRQRRDWKRLDLLNIERGVIGITRAHAAFAAEGLKFPWRIGKDNASAVAGFSKFDQ